MKKLLITGVALTALIGTPALAADMAVKAPPPPPAPAWTWTGCYIGGNVGAGWTRQSQNRVDQIGVGPAPAAYGSETDTSVVGGGQVGCDYQFASAWVIGIQGQFDWGNLNDSHVDSSFPTFTMYDKTKNFGTVTARLGYAFAPSVLAYVKGGGAWVRNNDVLMGSVPVPFLSESATWTRTGWTVGGGVEYHIAANWSVFAEYNYLGFGTRTIQFNAAPGLLPVGEHVAINQNVQDVLVGVNFRFNGH